MTGCDTIRITAINALWEEVAGECIFARDPDALAEYELYVLRRAGDLAPFERARRRQLLEKVPYDVWTAQ